MASAGAATTLPAQAIVVDQGAVARTMILLFAGFAAILLLVVMTLVALVGGPADRRARLRTSLVWFGAAGGAAILVLAVLSGSLSFAQLESALLYGVIFLVLAAVVLVARAFIASRRH